MEYLAKLQSGLKYMVEAGEVGRANVGGMLDPVNGAIRQISGAASDMEGIPFIGPAVGAKINRVMGAIGSAQSKVNQVVATYDRAERTVGMVKEKVGVLGEQYTRAKAVASKLIAKTQPQVETVVPTAALAPGATPAPEGVGAYPHLMVLLPLAANAQPFYFNLGTAAFDALQRTTAYRWASQERLGRRPALQAVGMGEEKLTLKGVIFPSFKGGLKQLDHLRAIGGRLVPMSLTTGYGLALGNWCLSTITEEQGAFLQGGIPRKQTFSLEFSRYGDDMQNI